jgi:AcrR family transcriptional regulator
MKNKSKKRQMLIDTAKNLFFKHGVKRVTIEEICQESNVSKVTFYRYFNDKNDLIKLIRNELTETGLSKFDEINRLPLSYPEKVDQMTTWRAKFFFAMNNEFVKDIIDLEAITDEIKNRYLKNIRLAQQKGEINRDLSPEIIWLVTEKFNEIIKEGKWESFLNDHTDVQTQLRQIYFYGLIKNENSSGGK